MSDERYVLVPVVATAGMIDGIVGHLFGWADPDPEVDAGHIWRAALSAAPPPDDAVIERVAEAIYKEDDPWHAAFPWPDINPDGNGSGATVKRYREIATAAIAALCGGRVDG